MLQRHQIFTKNSKKIFEKKTKKNFKPKFFFSKKNRNFFSKFIFKYFFRIFGKNFMRLAWEMAGLWQLVPKRTIHHLSIIYHLSYMSYYIFNWKYSPTQLKLVELANYNEWRDCQPLQNINDQRLHYLNMPITFDIN